MMTPSFRKDRKTGEWKIFGPAEAVVAGEWCKVRKADGSVRNIYIATVSRSFDVDGTPCVYGDIGQAPRKAPAAKPTPAPEPTYFGAPVTHEVDDCAADATEFSVF